MKAETAALLAAIAERSAELVARSGAIEEAGVLPDDVVAWMIEHNLFKLCVPKSLGGAELGIADLVRIYEALAAIDGSLGWQAQIGSGGGYFVPSFPPEVARRFFQEPHAVIAGSGYPGGTARRVPGGYIVSGRWRYASGAQYATLFTANAILEEGDGTAEGAPRIRAMAFLPHEVQVIHDWDAFGMRATSSWSIIAKEVFVPEERSFVVGQMLWDPGYPLYHLSFDLFAVASIAAVCVGVARSFFDAALEPDSTTGKAPSENADEVFRSGRKKAESWRQLFFTAADQLEAELMQGALDEARCEHFTWMMQQAAHRMRDLVLTAMPYLGIRGTRPSERVNRIIRDLLTACQHVVMRSA
ncbi:MAG TPA: acyl-CoA dehydrogenase family protein [Symbiobacteriaceae bacterium]